MSIQNRLSTVSVCLSTYNGSKYINAQLDSILNQSYFVDEIVIVDDNSNDNTFNILKNYQSVFPNISIYKSEKNLDYVKSFEKAISLSKKDIILLCDQDDIWTLDKVEKLVNIYNQNPIINIIYHNSFIIFDDQITKTNSPYNLPPRLYTKKDIIKEFIHARFFGFAFSFRSQIKDVLLPFNSFVYTHDHWLSICSLLSEGILVIDDKLAYYRRHKNTLTKHSKDSLALLLVNRMKFILLVFTYYIRRYKKNYEK